MSILDKLFGKESRTNIESLELQQFTATSTKGCWAAALWWAAKALESNPDSGVAKKAFLVALPQTFLAFLSLGVTVKRQQEEDKLAFKQGRMNTEEAQKIADHYIRVFYLDAIIHAYGSLFEKFNRGEFKEVSTIGHNDLKLAMDMAAAIGDEELPGFPGQQTRIQWKIKIQNPEAHSFASRVIETNRAAIIALLQTSSPSDWRRTCDYLSALFKVLPFQSAQDSAESYERCGGDSLSDEELQRRKDELAAIFARNIADLLFVQNSCRGPALVTKKV